MRPLICFQDTEAAEGAPGLIAGAPADGYTLQIAAGRRRPFAMSRIRRRRRSSPFPNPTPAPNLPTSHPLLLRALFALPVSVLRRTGGGMWGGGFNEPNQISPWLGVGNGSDERWEPRQKEALGGNHGLSPAVRY